MKYSLRRRSSFKLFERIGDRDNFTAAGIRMLSWLAISSRRGRTLTLVTLLRTLLKYSFHFFSCSSSWMNKRPLTSLTGSSIIVPIDMRFWNCYHFQQLLLPWLAFRHGAYNLELPAILHDVEAWPSHLRHYSQRLIEPSIPWIYWSASTMTPLTSRSKTPSAEHF